MKASKYDMKYLTELRTVFIYYNIVSHQKWLSGVKLKNVEVGYNTWLMHLRNVRI
jgi:hypothetical protein